ncbi:hypothetical protein HOU08_gp251 [Dickeya phage vB_DsoM_JA29]|uniref:Uncharacterized protein n=1 Tax=Dickeya phage vB_DsoM_JA29 TaxID=2283031 RepID=A0A384ZXM3_9CAUD|nr:hypothetical protein HOU08_gp251 [Dickeya phage vB_DsoM_JA29]AXG66977.1 hypothetical protein JA29_251 [Dickeya phage vB_DsoM_JA29]
MSSTTQINFVFPSLHSFEVTLGSGAVANFFGVRENEQHSFYGEDALRTMQNSNLIGALPPFDQAIVNLLISNQVQRDELIYERARPQVHYFEVESDEPNHNKHEGVLLVIHHFR